MSEVIVRMEMPERCGACMCRQVEFDIDRVAVFCGIKDNEYVEDADSRPSWCPIVGVLPEQHGDLIDRDALLKECYPDDEFDAHVIYADDINKAKAVIAATERSETWNNG